MSQYADPLDFVKEVRRLADRVKNLETLKVSRVALSTVLGAPDEMLLPITDTTNFDYYGTDQLWLVKSGRVVRMVGTAACRTPGFIDSGAAKQFSEVPAGWRPGRASYFGVMQGSGTNRWLLAVASSNGACTAERYGPGSSAGTNTWLPIDAMWIV